MTARNAVTTLATHEVTNQPPPLEDYNLFDHDAPLKDALRREGAAWAEDQARILGAVVGSERVIRLGRDANRFGPELRAFDRFGHRIDDVEFHPAYHELMELAIGAGIHSVPWTAPEGGYVAHAALDYMFVQAEAGVCCPIGMTFAAVPTLRRQPEVAAEWEPRVLSTQYDPRCVPAGEKSGVTIGMAMTEKQGGSDVRSNTTRAVPLGAGGPGEDYELTGHKWFASAPTSDAFLTLAYTEAGLSCFFVPRWQPDGSRNTILIQRLKDKLGNRSNASSEIEYQSTWGRMVGDEGRGVRTIMEMVHHTRLDTSIAPAGLMRQAVAQATHHTAHRTAFHALLTEQPLMKNVLADLALESEAATALVMRVARAFDEGREDGTARNFARIAVAAAKYWLNKRAPNHVYEAMECLGGAGYVEDSIMPRLYREAPLNSIWEGSGNVICLDVLRAIEREPDSMAALLEEISAVGGANHHLDSAVERLKGLLANRSEPEQRARRLTEAMALALQGAILVEHAPAAVADAFCASRLGGEWGHTYGTLPAGTPFDKIIARARPVLD